MKRSEMIDKIQLVLEELSRYNLSYRAEAYEILWCIDKAGMLPPCYDKGPAGFNEVYLMHAWEEE